MQTTLLGLAIAIILALVTALVGPFFVDWNAYRTEFGTEASRLVGLPVRVNGGIDVRLLPTPSLALGNVEIGNPGDGQTVKARTLGIEFALGPLMRGIFRASQMRVAGASFTLSLDKDGRVPLPKAATGFDLEALSIEHLDVEDAHLDLIDAASGTAIALDKLGFNGEVRSLAGVFRGEGAFTVNGGLYGYRIATQRPDDSGLKIRFSLDSPDRPLAAQGDGIVALDNGSPRYEGGLTLTRAVGTALADGRAVQNEPLRMTARVKAGAASALFEQIELQYGPDDRALKLGGTAEMAFGAQPQVSAVLSARQLDVDKLMTANGAPPRLPFDAVRALAQSLGAFPAMPARIGIAIDTVTLGGGAVQAVRGDFRSDGRAWDVEDVEFRAPGLSQVRLGGRIDLTDGFAFTGPVDVAAADPRALAGWIQGRNDLPPGAAKPVRARGEVAVGSEKIAIERLHADVDRKSVDGRLVYVFPTGDRKARLDAELRAAEFDVDALIDLGRAAFEGKTFERPGEVSLSLDIGRATIAGLEAKDTNAKLTLDAGGLQIERLTVADFGGAALDASGRIDTGGSAPRGNMTLNIDARDWSGVSALVATLKPEAADSVRQALARLGPAKLRASFGVEDAAGNPGRARAKLSDDGSASALRIGVKSEALTDANDIMRSDVKFDAAIDSDDANAVARLAGFDRTTAGKAGGRLTISASGPLNGAMRIGGKLTASPLDASAAGTLQLFGEQAPSGQLDLAIGGADLNRLRSVSQTRDAGAIPVALKSKISVTASAIAFENIAASVSGIPVRGRIDLALAPSRRVDGNIEIDALDAASLVAGAIGAPPSRADAALSSEPFTQGFWSDLPGRVAFRASQAALTPSLAAKNLRGVLRFGPTETAIEDIDGELAGGRMSGALAFRKAADGLNARASLTLKDAEAAAPLATLIKAPVSGRLGVQIEADGTGPNLRALIGSLAGSGIVTLEQGEIAGLDTRAFAAAIRAVDQGMGLDAASVTNVVAPSLDAGRLKVEHADGAITIVNGQARLGLMIARVEGAILAMSGNYDFVDRAVDARMTLASSAMTSSGVRPEIAIAWTGPALAPRRKLDVAALSGWLALRSVEQQAKRLEAIEAGRSVGEAPKSAPPVSPPDVVVPRARPSTAPASGETRSNAAAPLPPPIDIRPAPGR